ncbi:transposase family protein, partial [Singulisphaera rosea]
MNSRERDAWIPETVEPWTITNVHRDEAACRVVVFLERAADSPLSCPECGRACDGYDLQRRRWRYVDADQFQVTLDVSVPRCSCPEHGVNPIRVLRAELGDSMTDIVECSEADPHDVLPVHGWDHASRRGFFMSTIKAAAALFVGGAFLPEGDGRAEAAAPAESDWGALRGRIKGEVIPANA